MAALTQMPEHAIRLVMRMFVRAFTHSLLFEGAGHHLILLGSCSVIDLERVSERFYECEIGPCDWERRRAG